MQKQEEWAFVVAHRVYAHPQFLTSTESLKEEIETFNSITIKGNVHWLAKQEKLDALHTKHPDYRYASIVFAVENKEVAQQLLARKQISIAGRVVRLAKYHDVSDKTQCTSCYRLGHNKEMCKTRGCKFCAEAHHTKDHQSCKECKTTGRLCVHQKPNCTNCRGEHIATSSACSYRSKTTNASVSL
jgi:DNA gyrase/topoisomerase IV subunit A